jgi:hypothetical protein
MELQFLEPMHTDDAHLSVEFKKNCIQDNGEIDVLVSHVNFGLVLFSDKSGLLRSISLSKQV